MKKLMFAAMLFFVLAGTACVFEFFDLKRNRDWFHGLYTDWHLFEADYREDVKNIDKLRWDLEFEKDISSKWEEIAMEYKYLAEDFEMKYKEQWTINNRGLLKEKR